MKKMESEEIWQIMQWFNGLGLKIIGTETMGGDLVVTLSIPLLSEKST
jgi:hypothetical protein